MAHKIHNQKIFRLIREHLAHSDSLTWHSCEKHWSAAPDIIPELRQNPRNAAVDILGAFQPPQVILTVHSDMTDAETAVRKAVRFLEASIEESYHAGTNRNDGVNFQNHLEMLL